jgi:hypothetical protein
MDELPNIDHAVVSERKLTAYLLSLEHESGRGKARFFHRFGFHPDRWHVLKEALIEHARTNHVIMHEHSRFGIRYICEGPIRSPDGRNPMIRSVWFIDFGDEVPRLVSAYPLERRRP